MRCVCGGGGGGYLAMFFFEPTSWCHRPISSIYIMIDVCCCFMLETVYMSNCQNHNVITVRCDLLALFDKNTPLSLALLV